MGSSIKTLYSIEVELVGSDGAVNVQEPTVSEVAWLTVTVGCVLSNVTELTSVTVVT